MPWWRSGWTLPGAGAGWLDGPWVDGKEVEAKRSCDLPGVETGDVKAVKPAAGAFSLDGATDRRSFQAGRSGFGL